MTATSVIRQLEKLPARERRKVFAYVDVKLKQRRVRTLRGSRSPRPNSADDDIAPSPARVIATWDYLDGKS